MSNIEIFCRQVRARSAEHKEAVKVLSERSLTSPLIAILRQEVDSMVRVIFLLSISDSGFKASLIDKSVNGENWIQQNSNRRITDREMVNVASQLRGWTESVYKFGCSFIHLSNFHDHGSRDPFLALPENERNEISVVSKIVTKISVSARIDEGKRYYKRFFKPHLR